MDEKNALSKIVTSRKMPVLFIGSGISKRYLYHYPNWNELLETSFKKVNPDPYYYQKHKDALVRKNLTTFEVNTCLGTTIENEFNAAFYDRKIKLNIGHPKNPSWVKKGISPFKMFLADYFRKTKTNNNAYLQLEMDKFKALKNKISAIITTNYDLFLENEIFPVDYKVFTHQNELFSSDSYNIAEIYKIHGCATDADSILITENDYKSFDESRKLFIAKMLTLFAESPIIFLGYSFTDENIQSIIVDFLGCLTDKELYNINEHFVFISHKKDESDLIEIKRTITTKRGDTIPITEIQTDNYSKVYDTLNLITPGISPIRIRETKKIVKTIVDQNISSNNAESVIVGIDDLGDLDLASKPLAIAIGYKEHILSKIGYGLLSFEMIFEDVLFDNKRFNAESMCLERFKSLAYTQLIPVFKYVKQSKIKVPEDSRLGIYIEKHDSVDKIISKNVLRTLKNVPCIDDYNNLQKEVELVADLHKKSGILLKNINNYLISQIRETCINLFNYDRESAKTSTHFKRCVMYLDLMENWHN